MCNIYKLQCIGQSRNVCESNEKLKIIVIEQTFGIECSLQMYEIFVLYIICDLIELGESFTF